MAPSCDLLCVPDGAAFQVDTSMRRLLRGGVLVFVLKKELAFEEVAEGLPLREEPSSFP